jgi:hypothetical protein
MAKGMRSLALGLLLTTGCGEQSATTTRQTMEETGAAFAHVEPPTREVGAPIAAATFSSFRLTGADLAVYAKGIAFENARLRESVGRGGAEGMAAFVAALPEQTEPAAAAAAGVDVDHYRNVKLAVADVLDRVAARARPIVSDAPADDAVLHDSAAQVQAALDDPFAGLEADVARTFSARLQQIQALHDDNAALLAQAGG